MKYSLELSYFFSKIYPKPYVIYFYLALFYLVFIYIEWRSCSTLSFVGSQFISLNSLAPTWCLEFSFKQKRIHLFWVSWVSYFLVNQKVPKNTSIVKVWLNYELQINLRNFGFRNSFWLNKNYYFTLTFLTGWKK